MADIKGLIKTIHEYNKKYAITENSSEADKLIARIQEKKYTKEEYFATEKEVEDFMKSSAPESEKQKVRDSGYPESLYMICSAIREGRLGI